MHLQWAVESTTGLFKGHFNWQSIRSTHTRTLNTHLYKHTHTHTLCGSQSRMEDGTQMVRGSVYSVHQFVTHS